MIEGSRIKRKTERKASSSVETSSLPLSFTILPSIHPPDQCPLPPPSLPTQPRRNRLPHPPLLLRLPPPDLVVLSSRQLDLAQLLPLTTSSILVLLLLPLPPPRSPIPLLPLYPQHLQELVWKSNPRQIKHRRRTHSSLSRS